MPRCVGRGRGAAVPRLQVAGLDRDRGVRHGQPARARRLRHRPRSVQRLRVRTGHRAVLDDQERTERHQGRDRGRRQVQLGVRNGGVMIIPLSWLLEYAPLPEPVDAREVATRLTGIGLEIESVEEVGDDISGVVVARVLATAFGVTYTDPADAGLPEWAGEPGGPESAVYPASIDDPTACDRFALR